MRSYEIKLTSPGFDNAVNNLTKMGTALTRIEQRLAKLTTAGAGIDGLTKRIEKLADQVERLGVAAGGVRGGGGGGGVRSSSSGGGGTRFIAGPNQRLQTIAAQMPQALLQGNTAAVADLERAKRLSERSIALDARRKDDPEHLTRPGLLELFSQMNSLLGKLGRGDIGGSIITLGKLSGGRNTGGGVNIQQMGAYGLSSVTGGGSAGGGAAGMNLGAMAKAAGPIGMVVGGMVAAGFALKGFADIAQLGARSIQELSDAASQLGGTSAEVAGLRGLGVSPGQAGGLGSGLRSRLSSDPFAQAVGGFALPGHLTGQSDAPLLEAQMKRLRSLRDEGKLLEMVRQERVLGLETMHEELMASKAMRNLRGKDAVVGKQFGARWSQEDRSDWAVSQKRLRESMDMIGERMQQNVAFFMTPINNGLANLAQWFATTGITVGGNKSTNTPIAQNTSAIEELTKVLSQVVGGGPRARGALSPAQKAAVMRGMDWDAARNLGAFRL